MALVGDDQIEIARGIVPVDVDHALQGGDGDALLVLEAAPGAQHVTGVIGQVFVEGILGLFGQGDAVHQEQNAGDGIGLEQALDEGGGGAGLAGAGGHLHQQLAPAGVHFPAQGVDTFLLVVPPGNPLVDGHRQWVEPNLATGDAAFEIGLAEEGTDGARVGLVLIVPEQDFVAVGEEDKGHAIELFGIGPALFGGLLQIDGGPLGLHHRHGAAVAVA